MKGARGSYMTSKEARQNLLFLRNQFMCKDKWDIPYIEKQDIHGEYIEFLGFDNIKPNDFKNRNKIVHFFLDDYKFEKVYNYPQKYVDILKQYKAVLTPDFSLYSDMPLSLQLYNTFKNRWCGSYWQHNGIKVIPTISWSTLESFEFCFNGIEKGSTVAVSTLGVRKVKDLFLQGYNEMMKRIQPSLVICYSKPFPEMAGNIVFVDYLITTRKKVV